MKKTSLLLIMLIIIAIGMTIGCERDDICPESTSTTPRVILELFDFANQENSKNVIGLRVQGINNANVLAGYNVVSTNKLILPLRTDTTATQYKLHKEYTYSDNGTPNDSSDDVIGGNEDIITIKYTTELVFVSRACGYKTVFKNVSLTIVPDTNNWIKSRQSVTDNQSVEDETATHFNIFH